MKSSLRILIHFLPFLLITLNCHLQNSTQFSITTNSNDFLCPFITPRQGPRRHSFSVAEKASLVFRCLKMDVILLPAYASAGMFTESLCSNWSIHNNTNLIFTWRDWEKHDISQVSRPSERSVTRRLPSKMHICAHTLIRTWYKGHPIVSFTLER
jgi:hypothetical protein